VRHKLPDRTAEVYRRDGERRTGYATDAPVGATWDAELPGWILNDEIRTGR
jgi:hypothetical protein